MLRLAIAGISRGIRRQASNLDMSYEFLFMRGSGDQLAKTRPGDCSLPSPTHYLEGTPTMSSDKQPKEAVIKAYKDAPALTITAGGVTYAYRELGPKGGVPVIARDGDQRILFSGAEMLAQPVAHLLDRVVDLGYASGREDERVLSLGHRVYLGGDLEFRESVSERGAVCPLLRRRGRLACW